MAGSFYPGDPERLAADVDAYLAETATHLPTPTPKALIAPHAGYVYSGPIAGSAFRLLQPLRERVRRIVLIGPAHRVALQGLAASQADAFETPLGEVRVDRETAHAFEHSLEVQLPFLQRVLADFELVPLVAGDASAEDVAEVLELCWGGDETRIVISSDLSHYHAYAEARRLDAATTRAIEALDPARLGSDSACGRVPVRGLLLAARRRGLRARVLDVRNSGDTAGPADRVVGYGAYAFS